MSCAQSLLFVRVLFSMVGELRRPVLPTRSAPWFHPAGTGDRSGHPVIISDLDPYSDLVRVVFVTKPTQTWLLRFRSGIMQITSAAAL